ncbi:alpha/beta hydrolase [Candidatus Hodarchaeum mangrovi]
MNVFDLIYTSLFLFLLLSFALYLFTSYLIKYIFSKYPRNPYPDQPDWGRIEDIKVPGRNSKYLDGWIVYPEHIAQELGKVSMGDPKITKYKTILFIHGWGRDKGRMVSRARRFAQKEFISIFFSAQDHGKSSKVQRGMNIIRYKEDIEDIIAWWKNPLILVGHSLGGGAALLVAQSDLVIAIIAEAPPYAFPDDFKYLYKLGLKALTRFFLPGIILIHMLQRKKYQKTDYSPLAVAETIEKPVLLIHGMKDEIFPPENTVLLGKKIRNSQVWLPEESSHYNLEDHPEYASKVGKFLASLR